MVSGETRQRYGDNLPREVNPMERRQRLWVRTEGLFTLDDETGQWGGGVQPHCVSRDNEEEALIVAGESFIYNPVVVWRGSDDAGQTLYAIGEAIRSRSSFEGFIDIRWVLVFPMEGDSLFEPAPQDYLAFELLNSTAFSSGVTALVAAGLESRPSS